MKKVLLSSIILFAFLLTVGAQSLELYHNGELFSMGGSITVDGNPDQFELVSEIFVKNTKNEPMNVLCRKMEISVVPNTTNTFCWYTCWANSIFLSPQPVLIGAGETTDEFSGHYSPAGNAGITEMCYSFFDQNNPNDSTYFYVIYFASGVGIGEPAENENFVSHPYPNPAKSQVTFDYNFPAGTSSAVINIHNLLGERVREINLSGAAGKVVVGVDDLNDGIYFYSVNINNEIVETKRLVISK